MLGSYLKGHLVHRRKVELFFSIIFSSVESNNRSVEKEEEAFFSAPKRKPYIFESREEKTTTREQLDLDQKQKNLEEEGGKRFPLRL